MSTTVVTNLAAARNALEGSKGIVWFKRSRMDRATKIVVFSQPRQIETHRDMRTVSPAQQAIDLATELNCALRFAGQYSSTVGPFFYATTN
jgi:hypothetical protein